MTPRSGLPTGRRGSLPLAVVAAVLLLVAVGPWVAPHRSGEAVDRPFAGAAEHPPFGTDRLGRDVLSRLLHSGRPIVLVPTVATAVALAGGGVAGLVMARRRSRSTGRAEVLDLLIVVPPILVLLVVLGRVDDSRLTIAALTGLIGIPYVARFVRATAEPILGRAHVEQAVLRGESRRWILRHEVLPNMVGPLLSDAGLRFAGAVGVVTGVTVLGYGPEPPATDWAAMVTDNLGGLELNPWAALAPAAAIGTFAVAVNLTADRWSERWRR